MIHSDDAFCDVQKLTTELEVANAELQKERDAALILEQEKQALADTIADIEESNTNLWNQVAMLQVSIILLLCIINACSPAI